MANEERDRPHPGQFSLGSMHVSPPMGMAPRHIHALSTNQIIAKLIMGFEISEALGLGTSITITVGER